mmetsp:Transcript_10631/g.11692  ORF Transcript_10631/g.11692 Transcript_10631/m.11692 type:complete len:119 (+) Transcript_10631:83-439(+)
MSKLVEVLSQRIGLSNLGRSTSYNDGLIPKKRYEFVANLKAAKKVHHNTEITGPEMTKEEAFDIVGITEPDLNIDKLAERYERLMELNKEAHAVYLQSKIVTACTICLFWKQMVRFNF